MKYIMFWLGIFIIFSNRCFAISVAPVDITKMDIKELSICLEEHIITSEQLVQLYLDRITEFNPTYNAIRFINDQAIKEARMLDEMRDDGNIKGLLHGIPILVKTNIDVLGIPTTAGSKALSDNFPNTDAVVVKKLKAAGAIILATTNMSEFAFSARNSKSSYGNVLNAYNPLYSPYGSSGGSAVGVALSFAVASIGTDTNSSIRVPASAANLVGFRPRINLISTDGVIPYDTTRDVVGPITKTLNDAAIIMSVLTDIDYLKFTNSKSLEGKVIGVPLELYKGSKNSPLEINGLTYEAIVQLMDEKINYLLKKGAKIVYIDKFIDEYYFNIARNTLGGATFCSGFNNYLKGTKGTIRNFKELASSQDKIYSLNDYLKACEVDYKKDIWTKEKSIYTNYVDNIFKQYNLDVIIYPTTKNKLSTIKSDSLISVGTNIPSVINYPAVSMPLGFDELGLPYGLEFLALNEEVLYEVASIYENSQKEIVVPSAALSLYEIPLEVTTLVKNYQRAFKTNLSLYHEFIKETQSFFKEYKISEQVVKEAIRLNEKYANLLKGNIEDAPKIDLHSEYYFFFIVSILIILYLLIKYFVRSLFLPY